MALRQSTGLRNLLQGINTNQLVNGNFDSVVTSWTATVAATTSNVGSGQSGNCMRVAEAGGAAVGQAYQAITTRVGQVYKFTGYFKKGTADAGRFKIGTTSAGTEIWDSGALNDAAWALKTHVFIATATTTYIICETTDATAGEYSDFDTISVIPLARSVQDVFNFFNVKWYTGTQPSTPDTAPTGTLLCTMKNASVGATFADSVAGALSKPAAETWNGVCGAGGTVGWARISHIDDAGGTNTTEPRIDFRVSTSGAEMNFTSVNWDSGSTQGITDLPLTEPME